MKQAWLLLEDGTRWPGWAVGASGHCRGEVVFSTSMTGYQELLTDPSYAGQILISTVAHVGNVGTTPEDDESSRCWLAGYIVQDLCTKPSNWRSQKSLPEWLQERGVVGLTGVDTRALVRHLRHHGVMRGVLWHAESDCDEQAELKACPSMSGSNWVDTVTPQEPKVYGEGPRLVALDCGMKDEMLRLLIERGYSVLRAPAHFTAAQILEENPVGLFLSNGPGDPAALQSIVGEIKQVLGRVPIFGICLGHQLLGQALGASTFKLKYGHRGLNQPVLHLDSGRVEVTTQNHGFAVDPSSLPSHAHVTHKNLNDHTCEGLQAPSLRAFSVQYHPENAPGPQDSRYLFDQFVAWMGECYAQAH
jgi:carbamoyl-phosphate synthase small subunit